MIELKVCNVDGELGVVLPPEVIKTLDAREGDTVYLVNMLNGSYRLARHDEDFVEKMELVDGMMHEEDA
jgi:antitoxin component of MazEF toxin-antitoxin module